jgi:membrane protease YdiL (CAAX protease family)
MLSHRARPRHSTYQGENGVTTILAAAGTGVVVLLAGNLVWAVLGSWNLRIGTKVPWAIVPTALYLWAYWRVIGGSWVALSSSADRRAKLRANGLPARIWWASLAAGLLGFATLIALLVVAARLVRFPSGPPITTPIEMPIVTALSFLVMQSIVAGVSEEAAFRGYMQSMIERRYGLALAIFANGTLFGLLHFSNHPADVLLMLPYYVAVSAVYGGLTWAANSILPALVLHCAGDIVVLTRWWLTGRPEWQIGATTPSLVWDGGLDWPFVLAAAASIALAGLTVLAYAAVRKLRVVACAAPVRTEQAFIVGASSQEGVHP